MSICLVFGDGMESASCGCSGSYVRNEQSQDSDLDVLIEFSETPGLFKFVRLERELSDLVGIGQSGNPRCPQTQHISARPQPNHCGVLTKHGFAGHHI